MAIEGLEQNEQHLQGQVDADAQWLKEYALMLPESVEQSELLRIARRIDDEWHALARASAQLTAAQSERDGLAATLKRALDDGPA